MKKENWVWMPHPGHYCASTRCRFHLNTYVGEYVVSTVGEYVLPEVLWDAEAAAIGVTLTGLGDSREHQYLKKVGFAEVCLGRKYETMVFHAEHDEINKCCPWVQSSGTSLDMEGYNDPGEAMAGHLKLCQKWSNK